MIQIGPGAGDAYFGTLQEVRLNMQLLFNVFFKKGSWELKKIKISAKEVFTHETKKRTNMTYILGKINEKGGFVDKHGKPSIKGGHFFSLLFLF